MQAEVKYKLNADGQKASLLAGGDGKQRQVVTLDITESELELCAVRYDGSIEYDAITDESVDKPITTFAEVISITKTVEDKNRAVETAQIKKSEDRALKQIAAGHKRSFYRGYETISLDIRMSPEILDAAITFNDEARRLEIVYQQKEAADTAAKKAAEEAAREQYKADRSAWIDAHGSAYLKLATTSGYNCERKYVEERASLEFPGFDVDFDNNADWKSRSCPSESALQEAIAINSRTKTDLCSVVWLTSPAFTNAEKEEAEQWERPFAACEALAVRSFLDKFDLIKIID